MRQKLVAFAACLAVLFACGLTATADDDKPKDVKYSIEDVMKDGMKKGLCRKVASGKASGEEVDTLIAMLVDMAKQKPHKGDKESWKKKCEALVTAAKDVKAGKNGATERLKKAANCKACHSVHK